MSCNCNSGETPEYYITLDGVGANGYSPEINIVQEDTSSFKLNLINKNNEQITPAIPKLEYLNDTFVTNDTLSTTLEAYSTTVEMNTALDLKLNKDGSNATNPIALNNFKIQSVGTGTRVGSNGQLTLYGSTARPAYIPQGDTPKTLALFSDIPTIGNGIITIRQGGVTKGSFNVNQSTNNTIDLDAGGGGVSGNRINLITEDGTRGVSLGINNTTKEAFMTYDIIGGISFDLNLISGKTAPITLTKNSDGTYGIGLDYDNDTLKVNQNGKLYADIEAPTYTAGTGININNEEISVDSDYIEAHKAYLADGDTLTDPQGLQDVKYYNYSSFDKSKFTKVGSPTITDDGIASGFSRNDYLTIPVFDLTNFTFSMSFEVTSLDTTTVLQNDNTIWRIPTTQTYRNRLALYSDKTLGVGVLLEDTTNDASTLRTGALTALGRYKTIFMFNGTKYTFIVVYPDGSIVTKELSSTSKLSSNSNPVFIGTNSTDAERSFIAGNIDLKSIEVKNYGIPVFSGNKTGIDTIKPDDYTVVGTPTISADGIVSGLDRSNYITCDCINTDGEIIIPVPNVASNYSGEAVTGAYKVYKGSTWVNRWDLILDTSNTTINSIGFASYGGIDYETTKLLIKVIKSGYDYTVYLKIDDNDWILRGTYTKEVSPTSTIIKFQGGYNVDLNLYKNVINDSVINQPCLKIPYTKSKTGSKIADVSVRPRVTDMYKQFGYAPYYILDETNGNFTLPMGEIYGYITRLETLVSELQTRISALESNINGGGASEPVRQNLLGMSPLSLGRPQLLDELNPEDKMDTMDIEPIEEITQDEVEPQPIEDELAQEETEEEPIEETVEEQEEPQTIENEVVQEEAEEKEGGQDE